MYRSQAREYGIGARISLSFCPRFREHDHSGFGKKLSSTCLIQSPRLGLDARPLTSWRCRRPVFFPRIATCGVRVSDAYRHRCKPFRKSNFTANRPPVVQENLERAPHGNPATDRKAFASDLANTAALH